VKLALPACSLLAREYPASVTLGASAVTVPGQTSLCRRRVVQQRLTLVVAFNVSIRGLMVIVVTHAHFTICTDAGPCLPGAEYRTAAVHCR